MATETKRQDNQTEEEFFALVATGRRGVEDMLEKMQPEFQQIGAPNVRKDWSTWAQRALVYVTSEETLRPVIQSKKGILSVYRSLAKAAQMGLQIGGQFPHGYLVPFQGEAKLVATMDGYAFSAAHGPGAVLEYVPEIHEVHEQDTFRLDPARGVVEHAFDPRTDRGKLVGYYTRLVYKDGRIEVPYISIEDVEVIRDNYSNTNSPAWKKSRKDMLRKIAAKKLLKKPAAEAEGLSMLYQQDEALEWEPAVPPPTRNVSERMDDRLDRAATKMRTVEPGSDSDEEYTVELGGGDEGAPTEDGELF